MSQLMIVVAAIFVLLFAVGGWIALGIATFSWESKNRAAVVHEWILRTIPLPRRRDVMLFSGLALALFSIFYLLNQSSIKGRLIADVDFALERSQKIFSQSDSIQLTGVSSQSATPISLQRMGLTPEKMRLFGLTTLRGQMDDKIVSILTTKSQSGAWSTAMTRRPTSLFTSANELGLLMTPDVQAHLMNFQRQIPHHLSQAMAHGAGLALLTILSIYGWFLAWSKQFTKKRRAFLAQALQQNSLRMSQPTIAHRASPLKRFFAGSSQMFEADGKSFRYESDEPEIIGRLIELPSGGWSLMSEADFSAVQKTYELGEQPVQHAAA